MMRANINSWRYTHIPWLVVIVCWIALSINFNDWWLFLPGIVTFLLGRVTGANELQRVIRERMRETF